MFCFNLKMIISPTNNHSVYSSFHYMHQDRLEKRKSWQNTQQVRDLQISETIEMEELLDLQTHRYYNSHHKSDPTFEFTTNEEEK
jgi:hypothetical protein